MKIFGSRYEHEPLPGKKIEGMVLRLSFGIANEGYADLHPWPELGELPLETQLAGLASGEWTTTLQKSLVFANVDAKARRQNRNLLHGLDLPMSYTNKIKIKKDTDLSSIPEGIRLRLDFNGTLTKQEFESWWEALPLTIRESIDVIEDPYTTIEPCLVPASLLYSDWIANPHWAGKVLKPSRDFSGDSRASKVLFTHSLNHPLGQVAAIWEAARFYKKYPYLKQPCGFSIVDSKSFAPFNTLWHRQGPILKPAPGVGFGFDEALRDLKWEKIL